MKWECFSLSVYVIHAAGAREGLTLHRPSQHSGNEPHFSFSVPPKLQNGSVTKKIEKDNLKKQENVLAPFV